MVAIKKISQSKRSQLFIFGAILVVILGLLVRVLYSTYSSIWHDEGFSFALSSNSIGEIWRLAALDVHPPLYYELLHVWRILFGDSVFALRSLSIVCGTLVVILTIYFTKLISNRKAALLAGVFVAFNPILIHFSQETRMYALVTLFIFIMLIAVYWLVQSPKKIWPYTLFAISAALALYTHYFAALVIFSVWVYIASLQFPKKSTNKVNILLTWPWWLANIAILILFLPWLPNFYSQITRGQGLDWLSPGSLFTYFDTVWQFITLTDARKLPLGLYILAPILILSAAIYLSITEKTKFHFYRLLELVAFLPLAIAILISLRKPIVHERYFLFSAVLICIILAITIVQLFYQKHIVLLYLSITLVMLIQIVGIRNVHSQFSHRMDLAMEFVNKNCKDATAILNAEMYTYFDSSYYNRTGLQPYLYSGILTGVTKLNGYGESSLIQHKNIYVNDYNSYPSGSKICLIGKNKQRPYYNNIPQHWQLDSMTEAGYIQARLYLVK